MFFLGLGGGGGGLGCGCIVFFLNFFVSFCFFPSSSPVSLFRRRRRDGEGFAMETGPTNEQLRGAQENEQTNERTNELRNVRVRRSNRRDDRPGEMQ